MNINTHFKRIKQIHTGHSIGYFLDAWGNQKLYYGLYKNKINTEGYKTIKELKENNPEYKRAIKNF